MKAAPRFRSLLSLVVSFGVITSATPPLAFARSRSQVHFTGKATAVSRKLKLKKHDRLRLVEARAQNKQEITLLIASSPGANGKVVQVVKSAGGKVQYQDDDVSYLRVKVPTDSVEKIAQSPDVEALNIDGGVVYVSQDSVQPNKSQGGKNRVRPPDDNTPADNPYLPSRDMGVPQFISAHPTFDGRGVTVAIIDTNIDMLTPELQTAKTLDGSPTRKILDIRSAAASAVDPSDDRGRLSSYVKVDMAEEVQSGTTSMVHKDQRYVLPASGRYRVGILDERMNNNAKGDLNLDGNPPGSNGLFAVLWDEKTGTVWVDTNQDRSFVDEKALTDYHIKGDVGVFGKDNPAGPTRKTVGFAVQTDAAHRLVFITPGLALHGTAITGSAFGKGFFGGSLNGVAPEAQIVLVPFVGIAHSLIESLIVAVKHPQVDVVSIQAFYHMDLNDGDSTLSNVCDRLVERYKKPIFSAAGNGGDLINIVPEGAAARRVITVGSYISRETSAVNYGVATVRQDNIDIASSRGPTEVGVFKPDILAPTMALTTIPSFLPPQTYNNTYEPPPGYGVVGGTSTATPMAAAGAALLISAAKQTDVSYDAARLRWAITSSARYLPEYGAYEQGAGLFQVGRAWEALKNPNVPLEITSRAAIKTVLGRYLKEPNKGAGLYEREGWAAGQVGKRTITFTRNTGSKSPVTYSLRWLGNNGTFSCPETVSLPFGLPVTISVTIHPKTPGVHSAILNLDELGGPDASYQVMTSVVAAEEFTKAGNFRITHRGAAEWMDGRVYFFYVPPQSSALDVNMTILTGNARMGLIRPSGEPQYDLATYLIDPCQYQSTGSCSQSVVKPEPGVWQLVVENKNARGHSRFAVPNRATFIIDAALLRVDASSTASPVHSSSNGSNYTSRFKFTNRFASFTGGVTSQPLGSGFSARPTISQQDSSRVFEVNVTPGTESLIASIGNPSQAASDLDLYVFDCTAAECVLKDFSQRNQSEEQVEVQQPSPGKWKIVIDPFYVPGGESRFDYSDVFTNRKFGKIAAEENPALRLGASSWVQAVTVHVEAMPSGQRYLTGFVALRLRSTSGREFELGDNSSVNANEIILKQTMVRVRNVSGSVSSH